MRHRVGAAVGVLLLLAGVAGGQQGPDLDADSAPGYVQNVFHHSSVDSINVYNGSLTIPIALGPSYPIGPKLKLQAMLVYTSKVWEYNRPAQPQNEPDVHSLIADPSLGFGWNFTMGAIKKCGPTQGSTCYISPDGAEHLFGAPVGGYHKTIDASRFYLHFIDGTNGYEMWDEDGNRYVFSWNVTGFNDPWNDYRNDLGRGRDGWYLRRLEDPWGNGFDVDYFTGLGSQPCWAGPCPSVTGNSYIIKRIKAPDATDGDPTIEVTLGTDPQVSGVSNLIKSLIFKVSSSSEATWSLDYVASSIGSLTTPALSQIALPAASTSYDFTFNSGPIVTGYAGLLKTMDVPTGGTISYYWGTYVFHHGRPGSLPPSCQPTDSPPLGTSPVQWDARPTGNTNLPSEEPGIPYPPPPDCDPDNYFRWTDFVSGVIKRTETVGGVDAVTNYDQWGFPFGERGTGPTNSYGAQTVTLVTYPADVDGRRQATATLFTAGPGGNLAAAPGGSVGAEIRVATFDHDPYPGYFGPSNPPDQPLCGAGNDLDKLCIDNADRVVYRTYDYADQAAKIGQRRLQSERTNYGKGAADDTCPSPCKYHLVAFTPYSTWESNGRHYGVETHSGSPLGGNKTITTIWAPTTTPWRPNIFTHRVVSDLGAFSGQRDQDVYFQFDTNGFQKAELIYDDPGNKVLVHCSYPDTDGNVDAELWKTLTNQTSPPTSYNCGSSMPVVGSGGDEFGQNHTSEDGQRKSTCWIQRGSASACLGSGGGWYLLNLERDDVTGLTSSSQDTAGLSTTYTYDNLGRVLTIDPPDTEVLTNVSYDSPNQTTVTRNGGTGLSTNTRYTYDGLGRLVTERRLMADGTYAYQHHKFDGAGHAYFDSEWTASSSITITKDVATACITSLTTDPTTTRPSQAPGTFRLCYDPFGRPQQITGSKHSSLVSFDRSDGSNIANGDTKEKATTWCINTTFTFNPLTMDCSNGINAEQTTASDVLGRITSVTEPTLEATTYDWDVSGKLAKVTQGAQVRTFVYNRLGFLASETSPEIVGSVSYSSYDGIGNVLQRSEGGVTHTYTYDAAGRLSTDSVGSTRFLMNCYDGSSSSPNCPDSTPNFSGGTSPKGKLTRRVGSNPAYEALYPTGSSSISVTEDLTFSGLGGRLSARATSIAGGANAGTTETWTYNNLGLQLTHGHPRFPNGTDSAALTETLSYSNGMPSSIALSGKKIDNSTITAATITPEYTPAGTLKKYTAAQSGGATQVTTINQDVTLLPRPSSITTSLGGFSTGTYTYDGAGNVLSMGTDNFKYDNRSRLVSAFYNTGSTCTDSAGNTGRNQCFAYDRWANLTSVTGTNPRTLTTSTSTNRLSSGSYDNRGNLLSFGGQTLTWDDMSRQRKDVTASITWQYLYRGDPERLVRVPWWGTSGPAVTRREAARFFTQAEAWTPSTNCSEFFRSFLDVHCGDQDWQAIETLYDEGITGGCGSGNFCPDNPITRGQMMVFLLKVEHGSAYTPPACVGNIFTDVTCAGQFDAWIEQAYDEGLTGGCGGSLFCPNNNVTEWQMAVYINKPVIAPNYRGIPGGSFYTLRDDQNRVTTEFYESFPGRDNVYLGNLLVASYVSHANSGTLGWNFHTSDHLGSPRLTVNGQNGATIESLKYWPYGDKVGTPGAPIQKLAFASMERDPENNHYFDHARKHDFNLGRFVSPDKIGGLPADPQSWNRFTYSRDNPQKYVDPDGNLIDVALDVAFIAYDLFDIGSSIVAGESVTAAQVTALAADVVFAVVPFATGGGMIAREAKVAGESLTPMARGIQREAKVLKDIGEVKNTEKVGLKGGRQSVPDFQNSTAIGEIKDTKVVNDTEQLRVQRQAAQASGREHVVVTGTHTRVSKNVEANGTRVIRRRDLGPSAPCKPAPRCQANR